MAKQIKIYVGDPIQRVLDSQRMPQFATEDYFKFGEYGYPATNQINRYVERGLHCLLESIPELSNEAWGLVLNAFNNGEGAISSLSAFYFKQRIRDDLEVDGTDEEIKAVLGEEKPYFDEIMALDDFHWHGIREVSERFWSSTIFKRDDSFALSLYDIKRSLVLPSVDTVSLEFSKGDCFSYKDGLCGVVIREGFGFDNFITWSSESLAKDEELQAEMLDKLMEYGEYNPLLENSFNIFGVVGTWEIFSKINLSVQEESYLQDSDIFIEFDDCFVALSDINPLPFENSDVLEKIAEIIINFVSYFSVEMD